jgi:hypothetical protein
MGADSRAVLATRPASLATPPPCCALYPGRHPDRCQPRQPYPINQRLMSPCLAVSAWSDPRRNGTNRSQRPAATTDED